MATRISTVCDICGTEKKITNHWMVVSNAETQTFRVYKPPFRADMGASGIDVCGQECVSKAFSRWLDHGDFEEAKNSSAQQVRELRD